MKFKKTFYLNLSLFLLTVLLGSGTILVVKADLGDTGPNIYYEDVDGDGFGDSFATTTATELPAGYADVGGDCELSDAQINPGATEICDGIDNNCNFLIDEDWATSTYYIDEDGDGYGTSSSTIDECMLPEGYSLTDDDCNDADDQIHPGATEICDSIDNDCNGAVDDNVATTTYYLDADSDGYGDTSKATTSCSAPADYVSDNTDCNDDNSAINPGAEEICDGIDNNCDENIDDIVNTFYFDGDNDGYGNASEATTSCAAPADYVSDNTDCNDNNDNVNPGMNELCDDDIDNNCNAQVDEDCDTACNCDSDCNNNWQHGCGSEGQYRNHGQFVSCWAHYTNWMKKMGDISDWEKGGLMSSAAKFKFQGKFEFKFDNKFEYKSNDDDDNGKKPKKNNKSSKKHNKKK